MNDDLCFEKAREKYANGSCVEDGMKAVELARTVEEAMEVYIVADGTDGHTGCCKEAFSKALALAATDDDFVQIAGDLDESGGILSHYHELMLLLERMEIRHITIEQLGIRKG